VTDEVMTRETIRKALARFEGLAMTPERSGQIKATIEKALLGLRQAAGASMDLMLGDMGASLKERYEVAPDVTRLSGSNRKERRAQKSRARKLKKIGIR
jgi:hypothetical protein